MNGAASNGWLAPLRRALDAAPTPVTFFFRDDDAGWEDERLLELLALFARSPVPLDVAVIPAALRPELAAELRARARAAPGRLFLHQHGFAHANHEPSGRKCEFGPSRDEAAQRRDIEAGARRLHELLGDLVTPIFSPPWNRCTVATGRCLADLGFGALSRDSGAEPLAIAGLPELPVRIDWCRKRDGDRGAVIAQAAAEPGPVGIMLHHPSIDAGEQRALEELLAVLGSHSNVRCLSMTALLKL